MSFNERLGEHIRRLRKERGLSLLDVESSSGKEFRASVLGAYERGERAVSAARLARLSELYRVPLEAMMPREGSPRSGDGQLPLTLDLDRLNEAQSAEARAAIRYARHIQARRGEWTARMFRMRAEDFVALACALDTSLEELIRRLEEAGARA